MIGIIGAMDIEISGINSMMTNIQVKEISSVKFTEGEIHGKKIVTAVCGIGKVFAAICVQTMILEFKPDMIINSGVAGTLTNKLSVGDIAIADNVVQHDMDTSPLGDPIGMLSGINIVKLPCNEKIADKLENAINLLNIKHLRGTIASGDQFISSNDKKEWIKQTFDGIACEMEGASIGQVCYVNKTPFSVLRAISDSADNSSHMDYPLFVKLAAENSIKVIDSFIKNI